MSNAVKKLQETTALDGFSGFTTAVEGEDDLVLGSVIQGTKINFVDPHWSNVDTDAIITGSRLILVDMARVVNKWGVDNKAMLPPRFLGPNEPWPDFKALNAECPEDEWRERFGEMVGPWSGQHLLYFIDNTRDVNRFTWPSPLSTIGSRVCVREIVDQINLVRQYRGLVHPEVELGHKNWPTKKAGLKQRPYLLNNIRWIKPSADQTAGQLPASGGNPEVAPPATKDAQTVAPLTAKKITDDEIKF
jgi:hypothetical protein